MFVKKVLKNLMEYVKFGPSRIKVSRICLGTWQLPRSKRKICTACIKLMLKSSKGFLK